MRYPAHMNWSAIGIDVGGTKIEAARVVDGNVERVERAATPTESVAELVEAVAQTAAAVHRPRLPIGIALAGQIDRRAGVVLSSPNLPFRRTSLAAGLGERFAVPVLVDNDVRLAALGEHLAIDPPPQTLVALYIGTGIGAGVVIGNRSLAGAHNLAAEAGHATFIPGGEACDCGRRGCFEAYAGGRAVVRRAKARRDTAGSAADDLTDPGRVAAEAEAGDPACAAVWAEAVEAASSLAWNLVVLFDPDVFVLGGGVARSIPALGDAVADHLATQAWSGFDPPRALPARPDAAVLGAALTAWRALRNQ